MVKMAASFPAFLFATFAALQLCTIVEGGVLRLDKQQINPVRHEYEPGLSAEARVAIHRANKPREHTPNRQRIPQEKLKEYDHHRNEEHKATQNMHLSDRALRVARESFSGAKLKENEDRIYSSRKRLHEQVYFHGKAADAMVREATGQKH
ncbi:uncharacterized protein FA14DRAFT_56216 [Meira miltonrushii]|uniref:Uncharacterized protein n=1 Tax=Meira miltonrushii TaxID=1280837 RepID=A0A316V6E8_9BASI|nr:uncharacterized protein FA14DRAFT_56216 [Meira miltonrushii]PWN33157.1 hypothetical protein FA14DRAFT_56216 [Meira miltonrushii]